MNAQCSRGDIERERDREREREIERDSRFFLILHPQNNILVPWAAHHTPLWCGQLRDPTHPARGDQAGETLADRNLTSPSSFQSLKSQDVAILVQSVLIGVMADLSLYTINHRGRGLPERVDRLGEDDGT